MGAHNSCVSRYYTTNPIICLRWHIPCTISRHQLYKRSSSHTRARTHTHYSGAHQFMTSIATRHSYSAYNDVEDDVQDGTHTHTHKQQVTPLSRGGKQTSEKTTQPCTHTHTLGLDCDTGLTPGLNEVYVVRQVVATVCGMRSAVVCARSLARCSPARLTGKGVRARARAA